MCHMMHQPGYCQLWLDMLLDMLLAQDLLSKMLACNGVLTSSGKCLVAALTCF